MTKDEKIAFAISPEGQGDGIPALILGVPTGAWGYMADGKTHTFDLTSVGLPIKLVLFGGETHASVKRTLEALVLSTGVPVLDETRRDFSIKPKTNI
jgi:hypothetical protein